MPLVLTEQFGQISIPAQVKDLASFLHWIDSTDLPEKLPVRFLRGEVPLAVSESRSPDHVA